METIPAEIPLNYTTVKTTLGRIAKGLLAIPVSLLDLFPKHNGFIYLVDDNENKIKHRFTARDGSTRECRIGGMKQFYFDHKIQDGDELVLQKLDDDTFRLLPEKKFNRQYQRSLSLFENSTDDDAVQKTLEKVKKIANIDSATVLENEFIKLANIEGAPERKIKETTHTSRRQGVPPYLRKILLSVYEGKCQITQFFFLKKDGNPYFELHHIIPEWGNHIKNLLVVCPNIHAQFTYANAVPYFDKEDGWLRQVSFNGTFYNVFQKIDVLQKAFTKEVHY
jgi:hypothetical protein